MFVTVSSDGHVSDVSSTSKLNIGAMAVLSTPDKTGAYGLVYKQCQSW